MLQIHNALSRGSVPKGIKWEKRKSGRLVPTLPESMEPQTAEIWECYFELLFCGRFHLLRRIKEQRSNITCETEDLGNYLFSGTEINLDNLLNLLIDYPQKYAEMNLAGKAAQGKDVEVDVDNETGEQDITDDEKKGKGKKVKTGAEEAFDYDTISGYKAFGKLVSLLNVNTCPYCGQMFTCTVNKQGNDYIRLNQVDHYYPKSIYPYLALSIWNLIPSCAPCNNRKKDGEDRFLYPYQEGMGDHYRFVTHLKNGVSFLVGTTGAEGEFQISLESAEDREDDPLGEKPGYRVRAKTQIDKLGLGAIYSSHNGYVCDIFRQRYVFGDPYIDSLVSTLPELFQSRADVRAMLYMKSIKAEDIGKTPLDKLTRDIDHEIDKLLSASE